MFNFWRKTILSPWRVFYFLQVLGKPAMADMSLGLATAPILYAAETVPELKKIVKRRFKNNVSSNLSIM